MSANPGLRADLSQWFCTDGLAARVVEWADVGDGMRVLEPSAGGGAFVRQLLNRGATVTAIEIDRRLASRIKGGRGGTDRLHVLCADFLEVSPWADPFDLVVMNPPYEAGQDLAHVLHALKFAPRVVALLRLNFPAGKKRQNQLWHAHVLNRCAVLPRRPEFEGPGALGAKSDYAVFEICRSGGVQPAVLGWLP